MQHAGGADAELADGGAIDFAFLDAQTFGDAALAREVLDLFLAQARSCLPQFAGLAPRAQNDLAHRLKGSCQGIGARRAERACQAFEDAAAGDRASALAGLEAAFAEAEAAIRAHMASSLL